MQSKRLKFAPKLVSMILDGVKNTTWRVADDKDISAWDMLSFCHNDGVEFGYGRVLRTRETIFSDLTSDDFDGHEPFPSTEEMLRTYSDYYHTPITSDTKLKVIKFSFESRK